jgi:hypothetical protein
MSTGYANQLQSKNKKFTVEKLGSHPLKQMIKVDVVSCDF